MRGCNAKWRQNPIRDKSGSLLTHLKRKATEVYTFIWQMVLIFFRRKKMKCSTLTLLGRPFLVYTIVYLNLISNGSCYRIWHLLFCQHNKGSSVSLTNKLSYSPFSREDKKVQQILWLLQCRLHSVYTFAMCQLHIGTSEVLRLHVSKITHFFVVNLSIK